MTKTHRPATSQWKHVGRHLEDLADGRTVAPGDTIHLTEEQVADPHNQRLINDGQLIETTKKED